MADDGPPRTMYDLLAVMAALRDPVTGCPWDREQSFETIAPYTIEEAYEVADAIARRDMTALQDELGDLLLQVVYHAQLASEANAFSFDDVADGIVRKMVRRHPHVFGDTAAAADEVRANWDAIKAHERGAQGDDASALADVPLALPGLSRAVKLQNRAARVGFDWPSIAPVYKKLDEEIRELKTVPSNDPDAAADELGDLLFVIANLARHLKIDPEDACRRANAKFERRFRRIEAMLADMGRTAAESDLAEMDRLWDRAKAEERASKS